MDTLAPCPACDRHVRATESTCPFCASPLPSDLAGRAVPPAPRRLSRAAAFAFGASLTVAACGNGAQTESSGTNGTGGTTTGTTTGSTTTTTTHGAGGSDGGTGGSPADGGDGGESDAGDAGDGGIAPPYGHPLYGAPPPPPP